MKKKALSLVLVVLLLASCETPVDSSSTSVGPNSSDTSSTSVPDSSTSSSSSSSTTSSMTSSATSSVKQEIKVTIEGEDTLTLELLKSVQLTATVENASDPAVTWKSSNEKIATVTSGGLVTGVGTGAAVTITATSVEDPTKSAAVTIDVVLPDAPTIDEIGVRDNYTLDISYMVSETQMATITTKVTPNQVDYLSVEEGLGLVLKDDKVYQYQEDAKGVNVYTPDSALDLAPEVIEVMKASLDLGMGLTKEGALEANGYYFEESDTMPASIEYVVDDEIASLSLSLSVLLLPYFDLTGTITTALISPDGALVGLLTYVDYESYMAGSIAMIMTFREVGTTVCETVAETNFVESGEAGEDGGVNEDLVPDSQGGEGA